VSKKSTRRPSKWVKQNIRTRQKENRLLEVFMSISVTRNKKDKTKKHNFSKQRVTVRKGFVF